MRWTAECQRQFEQWQRRQELDQRLTEARIMRGATIRRIDAGMVAHLLTRDLDADPDPQPHRSDPYMMDPDEIADVMYEEVQ
jgi:hypothetical protein